MIYIYACQDNTPQEKSQNIRQIFSTGHRTVKGNPDSGAAGVSWLLCDAEIISRVS